MITAFGFLRMHVVILQRLCTCLTGSVPRLAELIGTHATLFDRIYEGPNLLI